MHYLFGIVVKADDEEYAKYKAETVLDESLTDIYDYYVGGEDGRWGNEFGKGVISANDEWFFETVDRLLKSQKLEYEYHLERMKEFEYYNNLYTEEKEGNWFEDGCYDLLAWSKYVAGEPMTDSYIFDCEKDTSRITKEMRENYRNNPGNYYMVLFDLHA